MVCKSFFRISENQSGWADSNYRPHAPQTYLFICLKFYIFVNALITQS